MPDPESLTENVVPPIAPMPPLVRDFSPEPWHRPRKQYIRQKQWNEEIGRHIIQRLAIGDSLIRVLGLPSTEFLDLLSMRPMCEEVRVQVLYLGFDANRTRTADGALATDVVGELGTERLIDTSSFV